MIDLRSKKDNAEIQADLNGVSFWQGLDHLAKGVNARVTLYRADGRIALVDGPWQDMPTSYSGLFRLTLRRITAVRDWEANSHFYRASIEVAWEPRFRPLLLETRPRSVVVEDDQGRILKGADEGAGLIAPQRRFASLIEVRLPVLERAAKMIRSLKGELSAVGPSRMLEIPFDTLDQLQATASLREKKVEGITAKISKLVLDEERWTVQLTVDKPAGGPKFESFQSWVANNEIFLVNTDGERLPSTSSLTESETETRAVVSYHFADSGGQKRTRGRNPAEWKVLYRTPAAIVTIPVRFEFKDIPLP